MEKGYVTKDVLTKEIEKIKKHADSIIEMPKFTEKNTGFPSEAELRFAQVED